MKGYAADFESSLYPLIRLRYGLNQSSQARSLSRHLDEEVPTKHYTLLMINLHIAKFYGNTDTPNFASSII